MPHRPPHRPPRRGVRRSFTGSLGAAAISAALAACAAPNPEARADSLASQSDRILADRAREAATLDSIRRADPEKWARDSALMDAVGRAGETEPPDSAVARAYRRHPMPKVPVNARPEPMPGSAADRAAEPARPNQPAPRVPIPRRPNDATPSVPNPDPPRPAPPDGAPAGGQDAAVARLEREARALASTAGCAAAGQCRVAPLGARACGGPREYIAYCPLSTDSARLFRKLAELARAERAYNERAGIGSICSMVMPPTPGYAGGRCTAGVP